MEEILKQEKSKSHKEFEKLLSEDLKIRRNFKEGDIVTGTVTSVGEKQLFVDIQAKAEGVLMVEELKLLKETYKENDKIEVLLEKLDSFSGDIIISRQKAQRMKTWRRMEASFEQKKEVTGMILSRVKGGFVAEVDSFLCFVPGSQVDVKPLKNFDHLFRKPLTFEIVKVDTKRGNIVLSRRAILEKIRDKDKDEIISKIAEGQIMQGVVKSIVDWGVFVDLQGVDSLLHITDISWSRINKPSELLSIGQPIRVKVTKIEPSTKKISVSIKHLTEDPYSSIIKKYEVGKTYPAVVTKVQDYGCFARLEDGLEGLIHQSELHWTQKNIHPNKVLAISQKIFCKLLEKNLEKRRVSLSYKQTLPNPWTKFSQSFKEGDECFGITKNVTDFAIFSTIKGTELDGMCHKNDVAHNPKDCDLEKFKKKGLEIRFKILEINQDNNRIRLGIKQLTEDYFEVFFKHKKVGDILTVVVSDTAQNGIYVNFGKKNLSILIKKKELAMDVENQRINRFNRGDKIDAIITSLDKKEREVSLSIAALDKKETQQAIKKYGSKDSGGRLAEILGPLLKKKSKEKK